MATNYQKKMFISFAIRITNKWKNKGIIFSTTSKAVLASVKSLVKYEHAKCLRIGYK